MNYLIRPRALSTISTIVTAVSIVIGVIFALLELRHLTETRKTEIIMKIYDRFGSRELVEAMSKCRQSRIAINRYRGRGANVQGDVVASSWLLFDTKGHKLRTLLLERECNQTPQIAITQQIQQPEIEKGTNSKLDRGPNLASDCVRL